MSRINHIHEDTHMFDYVTMICDSDSSKRERES